MITAARGAHVIVTLTFAAMAAIQLNDPDPAYWVVVYTLVAVVPAAKVFGIYLTKTITVSSGMVLAGLLISAPGFIDYLASTDYAAIAGNMSSEKAYVESAREFIGLLIAAAGLAFYGAVGQR